MVATESRGVRNKPNLRCGEASVGQPRQTNPVQPGRPGSWEKGNTRNEPNSAPGGSYSGTECAKQTQFAGAHCAKRTQFLRPARVPEDKMCKTKPICRGVLSLKREVLSKRSWQPRAIVQNKPDLQELSMVRHGLIARNKPNSGLGCSYGRHGMCETNPIRTPGEESVGQAPPCEWAQLRQTNPVPACQAPGGIWNLPAYAGLHTFPGNPQLSLDFVGPDR